MIGLYRYLNLVGELRIRTCNYYKEFYTVAKLLSLPNDCLFIATVFIVIYESSSKSVSIQIIETLFENIFIYVNFEIFQDVQEILLAEFLNGYFLFFSLT